MFAELWHQFSASGVGFLAGVGAGYLIWGYPWPWKTGDGE